MRSYKENEVNSLSLSLLLNMIGINVAYVSLFTLRMMFVLKGQRLLASILSILEVYIYIIGLTFVLKNLDHPVKIFAYCLGFGIGVYLGMRIEEYLALGYTTVQVFLDPFEQEVSARLRKRGYKITSWTADGKDGKQMVIQVVVKRRNENYLLGIIHQLAPQAFVVSFDTKDIRGRF